MGYPIYAEMTDGEGSTIDVLCGHIEGVGRLDGSVDDGFVVDITSRAGDFFLGHFRCVGPHWAPPTDVIMGSVQAYGKIWASAWVSIQTYKVQTIGLKIEILDELTHIILFEDEGCRVGVQSIVFFNGMYNPLPIPNNTVGFPKFKDALSATLNCRYMPTYRFSVKTQSLVDLWDIDTVQEGPHEMKQGQSYTYTYGMDMILDIQCRFQAGPPLGQKGPGESQEDC